MRKKGQGAEVLFYILAAIGVGIGIYYGVSSAMQIQSQAGESEHLLLINTIKTDVGRISAQVGSNRTFGYDLGSDYRTICFSDTTKNSQIANDDQVPDLIRDSAADDSKNNVFLLGPEKTEAFSAGEIRVCSKNVTCFEATQGNVNVRMYGGGGYALFEPCETLSNPYPRCYADEAANPLYNKTVISVGNVNEAVSIEMLAAESAQVLSILAGATHQSALDFEWYVVDPDGNDNTISGAQNVIVPPDKPDTFNLQATQFGVYRITGIAKSRLTGLQCSVTFLREFAAPGAHYPIAQIIKPAENVLPKGIGLGFKGAANDMFYGGPLNYSWDFGTDDTTPSGRVTATAQTPDREAGEEKNSTAVTKAFTEKDISVLVKFTVTNSGGYSTTDSKRYTIGNIPPWIILWSPANNKVFKTAGAVEIPFSFTPSDDQSNLDCQLIVDGNIVKSFSSIPKDVLQTHTITFAPLLFTPEQHFWKVSCSDGVASNSSETRIFNVEKVSGPIVGITIDSPQPPYYILDDIQFIGSVSDQQPGGFSYVWKVGTPEPPQTYPRTGTEDANIPYTHQFAAPGDYLVELNVTNTQTGAQGYANITLSLQNHIPSVTLLYPADESTVNSPLDLNFSANDEEPQDMSCTYHISGQSEATYDYPQSKFNMVHNHSIELAPGDYSWNVSCTDMIDTTFSETRTFTVEEVLPPVLRCTVLPGSCGTLTPMLSLSGITNAHVSTDTSGAIYLNLLCCNLTREGDSQNYLNAPTYTCTNPFIRLSSNFNAHASYSYSFYSFPVCFDANLPSTDIICNVKQDPTPCDSEEICVLTLSSTVSPDYSNSHVASCTGAGAYPSKICCKVQS